MNLMWSKIYDIIIKTFISVDHHIQTSIQKIGTWNNNAFELYGFDVMIDKDLNPYVLEVNLSPSLSADTSMDFQIKSSLVQDTFNLVGIQKHNPRAKSPTPFNKSKPLKPIGKVKNPKGKNSDSMIEERVRRNSRTKLNDDWLVSKMGNLLSEKIQRILKETIIEDQRKGRFI